MYGSDNEEKKRKNNKKICYPHHNTYTTIIGYIQLLTHCN